MVQLRYCYDQSGIMPELEEGSDDTAENLNMFLKTTVMIQYSTVLHSYKNDSKLACKGVSVDSIDTVSMNFFN